MGRGEAARRRAKNQAAALVMKGKKKELATAPAAGSSRQSDDGMTRAMRKLLQLKAAASGKGQPPQLQRRVGVQRGAPQQGQGQGQERPQQDQQQQQSGDAAAKPSAQRAAAAFAHKGLKDGKKQFLKRKQLKKSGKLAASGPTDKEAALAAATAASRPAFGEQAHQPLKVQLKRKHWAREGTEGTEQQAASKRCSEIFNRQMDSARVAAAAADAGLGALPAQPWRGQKPHKQRGEKQQTKQQAEEVRQQLIHAYRQQKLSRLEEAGRAPLLSATAQSLAALVRKDAGKAG